MWIESHVEIWQHPKTRKLARLLDVSVPTAVGHLHGLWYWALSYAQDGIISRFDPEEIADAVLWDGDPKTFVDALVSSGYADSTPDGIELHDWYEYTGRIMEQREIKKEQARIRKQRQREKESQMDSHTDVTRDSHDVTLLPTNQHTITNPPIAPRGESRGIEKEPSIQEQRFSEFWRCYPKKTAKKAALKSWLRIKPAPELHEKIMQAVALQSKTEQWTKDGGQFIPNPSTWLNGRRWEDEAECPPGVKPGESSMQKENWGWGNG